jgi:hypothetical protein
LTCIVVVDERVKNPEEFFPSYLKIYKDITDIEDYMPFTFAREDYKMSEEDKENTNENIEESPTDFFQMEELKKDQDDTLNSVIIP